MKLQNQIELPMSKKSTNPVLEKILIVIIAIGVAGAFFYYYATYPANDFRVARKLQSRGFGVQSDWQDSLIWHDDTIWQRPAFVHSFGLNITADDCQLISQLPRLRSLSLHDGDMSGLNLDEIGHCPQLELFGCYNVTQFSANELRKLDACPLEHLRLQSMGLKDSDLENLAGLKKLKEISLWDNVGITDASFKHFEKIVHLKRLGVSKTSVTKEGVAEFQKKRPDVIIHFEE